MKYIITILLLTFSLTSFAEGVYLGGWSLDREYNTWYGGKTEANTSHRIVGIEYKNWMLAKFENSYFYTGYIVGRKYHIYSHSNVELDLSAGGVYGYTGCSGEATFTKNESKKWCPAIVPEISYTKYKVQPSLMLMNGTPVLAIKIDY